MRSNAVLFIEELVEHFANDANHHLYKKNDDESLTCWMCSDFEIVDSGEVILKGVCGDGITYDLENGNLEIEKGN